MTKVSVIHCDNYDRAVISRAIAQHFENLGGIERFVTAGDNVLIKPNLICPKPIEQPAQTHPAVICEVAKLVIAAGAKVTVADSPAWSDTLNCLKALGADTELLDMGVRICDLNIPKPVELPLTGLKATVSKVALDADKIINLPKLKAHQQMTATIAVKNMFGAVPGKRKALWHYRQGESPDVFAAMLLGVFLRLKPVINIVDAVVAMEGQGPINGRAKHIGLLLASEDAVACETICSRIIALEGDSIPILRVARELSVGCSDIEQIKIIGDSIEEHICSDFLQAIPLPLKFTLPRICKSVAKQILILFKHKTS